MATAVHSLGRRRSILVSALGVLLALVAGVTGHAKANLGLLVDVSLFTLLAFGVGVWVDPGAGMVAGALGGLVLRDFGDRPSGS